MCAAYRIPVLPMNWRESPAAERMDLLCEAFARDWQSGGNPSVTEFLDAAPAFDRDVLRRRLDELQRQLQDQRSHASEAIDSENVSLASTVAHPPPARSDPSPPPPPSDAAPAMLGRYRLETLLGRGGGGEVWRSHDPLLQRSVAVKRARPDAAVLSTAEADLFLAEGRKLAQLNHPGIVRVYDVGFENGAGYIVSELVEGETLADLLARGRPPCAEAARIVAEVAEAAHAAHLQGIVHRDIKPSNILIEAGGRARLADFGLAVTEEEQLAERAATLGTYAYMSPEQLQGQSHLADARADVYSLGVVLYQLLTGRLPYVAKTPDQYRALVFERQPRPPRTIVDTVPPELEQLCLNCLSREAAARPTTAQDVATELRRYLEPVVSSRRSLRRVVFGVCGAAAAVVGIVWVVASLIAGRWETPKDDSVVAVGAAGRNSTAAAVPPTSASADVERVASSDEIVVTPLVWLPSELESGWQTLKGGTSLRAESTDAGLLRFGELDGENDVVELELHQLRWSGGIGVFFGHKIRTDDTGPRGTFQALVLEPHSDGGWQLMRTLCDYPLREPMRWWVHYLDDELLGELGGRPLAFVLRFAAGRLAEVTINGRALELTDTTSGSDSETDVRAGEFGLLVRNSSGVLSNLVINGRSRRFAQPP